MDVENAHQAVLDATGLAFVLYDLRHTFATRFYERTKDVVALKDVLGHSNLRTIMKYVHINGEHVRGAMKVFEMGQVPVRSGFGPGLRAEIAKSAKTSDNESKPPNTKIQ